MPLDVIDSRLECLRRRSRFFSITSAYVVFLLFLFQGAAAQLATGHPESGTISGIVVDQDQRRLPGATVYALSEHDIRELPVRIVYLSVF